MANKPSYQHRRSEQGYTLIELMVGLIIIAISVLALYEMFLQGTRMINDEYDRQEALNHAYNYVEKLAPYVQICDTIPRNLSGHFQEYLYPEVEGVDPILVDYTIDISFSNDRREDGVPQFSHVEMDYRWVSRTGREEIITLERDY